MRFAAEKPDIPENPGQIALFSPVRIMVIAQTLARLIYQFLVGIRSEFVSTISEFVVAFQFYPPHYIQCMKKLAVDYRHGKL